MNKMNCSLIFCFVVGTVFAAEKESKSAYIKTRENKRLHGYVFKKIDSTDEMSCSQACLRHSWGTSFNFKESSANCELNKHDFSTTDDDTKLTDNPAMFSPSQIFLFPKIITKGNVFFPNKRLTCFENEVKRSIECKQP